MPPRMMARVVPKGKEGPTDRDLSRGAGPLLGLVAAGEVPIDERMARIVGDSLRRKWEDHQRE